MHSWADLVVAALCALVVFALKTELFFYMFESVEVFYLRMKLLRRFNQLTALPLGRWQVDWLSANGIRRWLQLRHRVLCYYEARYMALQVHTGKRSHRPMGKLDHKLFVLHHANKGLGRFSFSSNNGSFLCELTFDSPRTPADVECRSVCLHDRSWRGLGRSGTVCQRRGQS